MRLTLAAALALALCLCGGPAPAGGVPPHGGRTGSVDLLVSPMAVTATEDRRTVGVNLGALFALRAWRTLHRPTPADGPDAVQSATVYWPVDEGQVIDTPEAAASQGASLVLWGAARHYGDGYLVDPYLSLTAWAGTASQAGVWTVALPRGQVSLGLPRRIFALGTALLPDELVERYSTPGALRVCAQKVQACDGPQVGEGMTARIQEPGWSQVITNDHVTGWIYLPGLTGGAADIGAFPGAVVAYYRGEFAYAARLFDGVARDEAEPDQLRSDARALAIAARSRTDPASAAPDAARLTEAPGSAYDVQVAVMNRLTEAGRSDRAVRAAAMAAAAAYVRRWSKLFEVDDPWLGQVERVLGVGASKS